MKYSETRLPTVAVVIPTLNEEETLSATLAAAFSQKDRNTRILIADGGSTDGTKSIATQYGVQVAETSRTGRGCQIAAVVNKLENDVVLILHADMILPPQAIVQVQRWLLDHPSCPGGCLGHRFDSPRTIYRFIEWWDAHRARRGVSYGDQAQFFRRSLIEQVGGFPDQPIIEDWELSRKLLALGRPAYLDCPVVVSARRYERLGWFRTMWTNFALRRAYRQCGPANCWKLYQRYYQSIESAKVDGPSRLEKQPHRDPHDRKEREQTHGQFP